MVDLLVKYRNGQSEIAQTGISFSEAAELGSWYKAHTVTGHPYEVINFTILPY